MQARALIMLVFAVIIGGVAAYLVSNQLQQTTDQVIVERVETRPVVVAARDLEIGATIDQVMLTTVEWPVAGVPDGAFQDIETAVGKEEPRVILREIRKGEIVLPYKLSVEGARGGLTPRIPENMRAMTISIDEIRGVAGFVLPGDKVDLLHTTSIGAGEKLTTRTLMQNMLVLGIAQETNQKKNEPMVVRSVTLLVTPRQAQMLTLAQRVGTISMVLRNEADVDLVRGGAVTEASLITSQVGPQPAPTAIAGAEKPTPKKAVRKWRPVVVKQEDISEKVEVIRGLSIQKKKVKPPVKAEAEKSEETKAAEKK